MVVKHLSDANTDGTSLGTSATDKVSFYGATPVAQRSLAAQATSLISSSSDFTAAHLAALKEVMATMLAMGFWKGSA